MVTARDFLLRGLLAGLLAGIAAFGVAYVVGEPSVSAAIALEESGSVGHTHADQPAGVESPTQVPRTVQATAGLLTGTVVAGVTLGGLLGVLSGLALGRFGGLGTRATTLLIAGIGFAAVQLLPFVASPPNPPGVGRAETIGLRTTLYAVLLAISVIAAVTAVVVGRQLAGRWGAWSAGLAAAGGYLVLTLVATALLPSYDEVPAGYPASLLYEFRAASLGTQLTLWAVLGIVLAELLHRRQRRSAGSAPAGSAYDVAR